MGLPVSLPDHIRRLADLGRDSSLLLSHPVNSGFVPASFRRRDTSPDGSKHKLALISGSELTLRPLLSAVWTFLPVPYFVLVQGSHLIFRSLPLLYQNKANFATIRCMKNALVLGAGGFIGSHLVKRLKNDGFWVRGVDLKYPKYSPTEADDFVIADLRDLNLLPKIMDSPFAEVYQLAADMGGAGYIFTGDNDANVMHNSALINLNCVEYAVKSGVKRLFYSSSACVYPEYNQMEPDNPKTSEDSAYPAAPDSEYGWEKIFSERLFLAYRRNYNLDVRIARFHNVFGPEGSFDDGREKVPAAICRKVAEAKDQGTIEMWGDGRQTRSFLYIDECLNGVRKLMDSEDFFGPVNIGSEEMVSINKLAEMVIGISGKKLKIRHIKGPLGVRGRKSDNSLIKDKLGWEPKTKLLEGLKKTYPWILKHVQDRISS